jgi:hypothetical protein
MADYQPGVCNIGEAEQRQRYAVGAVGMTGTLVVVAGVLSGVGPRWVLLATAIPLFGAALGYLQGRLGFCVGYGLRGRYDATDDGAGTGTERVDDEAARAVDRRRGLAVVGYAAAAAVAGALVVYGIGHLVV